MIVFVKYIKASVCEFQKHVYDCFMYLAVVFIFLYRPVAFNNIYMFKLFICCVYFIMFVKYEATL